MLGTGVAHAIERITGDGVGGSRRAPAHIEAVRLWTASPLTWRAFVIAVGGATAAAGVGYATSQNPAAAPAHVAVTLRVLIIVMLIAAGVYGHTNRSQARMATLLLIAGFYSALWLLNGSSNRLLFSVGVLCSAFAPMLFAYLMLAYPTGRLHSRTEQRLVWQIGGLFAMLGILVLVVTGQPPIRAPLVRCSPHCQASIFSFASATEVGAVLSVPFVVAWSAITCGVPILIYRRMGSAPGPLRRSLTPVFVAAIASAGLLIASLASRATGSALATAFGVAYLEVTVAVPLAILMGLSRERLFIGGALADFVNQLARAPTDDPQRLMARAMGDPSLSIAYRRPGTGTYVDSSGRAVPELPSDRATTWIERDRVPVAAVFYSPELADQERFLHAAGSAVLMELERAQLEADLRASVADLEASRVRLMEAANTERRRLERDLHDGVQQQLIALRIKLDLAAEKVKDDVAEGERMLASLGDQMDGVLQGLRSLARGIYPSVLHERGLVDALKSIARDSPIAVTVRGIGVGRYPEDAEVAVYFCCLEAVQNIVKHAGVDAEGTVHLWQDGPWLYFEVRDCGRGFEPGAASAGVGLTNMRDRIQAVGGTLTITSSPGHRTSVRGAVPVASAVRRDLRRMPAPGDNTCAPPCATAEPGGR